MHCRLIALFLVATVIPAPARSDTVSQIRVSSEPAIADMAPLPAGRRLIRLPTLTFVFTIEPRCENNMQVESISISVADTRETVTMGETTGSSVVEATITIPRRQAAPLAVADSCDIDEDETRQSRELLVRGAFTAHLSLRCANDERQSIVYASHALDLSLRCKAETQAPSPDSIAR